jgi:hypothetical protein
MNTRKPTLSLTWGKVDDAFVVRCAENGLVATDLDERAAIAKMFTLLWRQIQFEIRQEATQRAEASLGTPGREKEGS